MAVVDPRDVYRKLIAGLGITPSKTPGEGEFGIDKYGRLLINPLDAAGKAKKYFGNGFNPNEFWYQNNGTGPERDRATLLAQIDPWLNRYRDMKAKGLLGVDDANALADHYLRGVGVPEQLKGGNRPQWMTDYIINALRELGATNIGNQPNAYPE